jgi:hypothetical protein
MLSLVSIRHLFFSLTEKEHLIMAKVQGPLMSMQASGTYAGALTFGTWKGRPVCRQRVDPSNPQSAGQESARNKMRLTAVIQKFCNLTTTKRSGETVTDKAELIANSPSGQAWNGHLVKSVIGVAGANYATIQAAWDALTGGNKTTWNNAAAALSPPITAVAQTTAGGASTTALTAGQAHYFLQYGLYFAGVAAAAPVAGVPPTYA